MTMTISERVSYIEEYLWGGGPGGGAGDRVPPPGPDVASDVRQIYDILEDVLTTQRKLVPETERRRIDARLEQVIQRLAELNRRTNRPRGGTATV